MHFGEHRPQLPDGVEVVPAPVRARTHREDQRVEKAILHRDPMLVHLGGELDQILHALLRAVGHSFGARRVAGQVGVVLLGYGVQHVASFLQIDRVDERTAPLRIVHPESGLERPRIGRINAEDRVRHRLNGLHQPAHPLHPLFREWRHLVDAQVDDVRPRVALCLHRRLEIVQILVPKTLGHVEDHRGLVRYRILGKRVREVEEPLGPGEVCIAEPASVAFLHDPRAVALDLAGRVEILANDDQAAMLNSHEGLP